MGFHHCPSDETLAALVKANFALFLFVRDPLDIIVSCTRKNDTSSNKPDTLLADFDWFTELAKQIRDFYEHALKYEGSFFVTHYEDLIEDPIAKI